MRDRHADFADLAVGQRMVGIVTGLGRQIEGDRETGLAFAEVLAVELVRLVRGRMTGIGTEDPGLVTPRLYHGPALAPVHAAPRGLCRIVHRNTWLGNPPKVWPRWQRALASSDATGGRPLI